MKEVKSNPRLMEFTDDELLDELESRFDHMIFAGSKDIATEKAACGARATRTRRWSGRHEICSGLAMCIIPDVHNAVFGVNPEDVREA
jgi:hypothetical protein